MKIKAKIKQFIRNSLMRFLGDSFSTSRSESGTAVIDSTSVQQSLMAVQIEYLLDEASELRSIVRHLAAVSPNYQHIIEDTRDSFDYQWKNLSEGLHLVSDKNFRENSISLLEQYTDKNREWFQGKLVLDAGCGNGRWSWTLCQCGAKVTAVDISKSGVEETSELCHEFPGFQARQHNVLEKLSMPTAFDMVFSYGVVHHTGNTFQAVQNLAECVKPGGHLFLMVYGEPRSTHVEDYIEVNQYALLRRKLSSMDFDERVNFLSTEKGEQYVHGWFDAVSPRINDLYRFDELTIWLLSLGFYDIHLTMPNRNLHLIATRTKK